MKTDECWMEAAYCEYKSQEKAFQHEPMKMVPSVTALLLFRSMAGTKGRATSISTQSTIRS